MKIAIVTGASSGMGREFAKRIGKRRDVDLVWVIARREDKLRALRKDVHKPIKTIAMDLTDKESFRKLGEMLESQKPVVRYLVNAAGMGKIGMSRDLTLEENENMIDLNCRAAVDMTLTCLPYMERGSRLINICSVAGYQPLTGLNTYAASKSFLLSWTKALHHELHGTGIHVTAVCPYWVKDTEFISGAKDAKKKDASKVIRHFPLASRMRSVVPWGMLGADLNLWVVSASPVAMFERVFSWIVPDCIIVPLWDGLRRL